MKKTIPLIVLTILVISLLAGCTPSVNSSITEYTVGSPKDFQKAGLTITLTDKFYEEESKQGFEAFFSAVFGAVCVEVENFSDKEELSSQSCEEHIRKVIENTGIAGIEAKCQDDLWFFDAYSGSSFIRTYCFKGAEAFYLVMFICEPEDNQNMHIYFHMWAQSIKLENP